MIREGQRKQQCLGLWSLQIDVLKCICLIQRKPQKAVRMNLPLLLYHWSKSRTEEREIEGLFCKYLVTI